jgi:DNA-binding response OmpR family regulator
MTGSKILIVDDEPFNLDLLEQELQDMGHLVECAANGQEALDQVAAAPPDLILLDVMMPVMDGLTVCRTLKADEDTRLIPIVFMTALGQLEDRIAGIEAGGDDFLTKPVNPRELMARIETALRLKHTMDRRLKKLTKISDHFAKFVPDAIRRLVAENPDDPQLSEKHEREVSVLFLDISGYSRLSEQMPPEELNLLVERYFSAFLDQIQEAGGDINETAGDGFMALFQDEDRTSHVSRAVGTALKMLETTARLNREDSIRPLSVHMGINSGTALVGSTRFEGARGTRWTFTASGPVTNLAARLANAAGAGQVLVGPETAHCLGEGFDLELVGRKKLKNIGEEVDMYQVRAGL